MLNENTPTIDISREDDNFGNFAKELSFRVKEKLLPWILDQREPSAKPVVLVRVNVSIFDAYLAGFPEDIRQQYNCRTCAGFLDGIGSFGLIDDNYTLSSLVFNEDDSWVPERYKGAYQSIVSVFKNQNQSCHIVCAEEIHTLGNFIGTTDMAGGFNHFGLDSELRTSIQSALVSSAKDPARVGHGYGQTELKVIHDWLQLIADTDLLTHPLPLDQFREKDRFIYEQIMARTNDYLNNNRSLFVKFIVGTLGLELLHLKNSVVGQLIQDIAKGLPFHEAHARYLSYIDPRYYKRPVRLPSEKEFEDSVKFLSDNGYDKLLPQRGAVFEEIEPRLTWIKKPEHPEVKNMFDTLRAKVTSEKSPHEKHIVEMEQISTNGLVSFIENLGDDLVSIKHGFNRHTVGSYVAGVDQDAGKIYNDGNLIQPWYSGAPVTKHEALRFYKLTSDSVDGFLIFDWDDTYRALVMVTKGVWLIPIPAVFAEDYVIPELRPHMRTIMHWAATAPTNTNDDKGVIQYDNAPITVIVDIGHTVEIETVTSIYRFEITARR